MRAEEGIGGGQEREKDNETEREGRRGGRVAESIWAVKLLQQVGGQWFGHTTMDLCYTLCRPFQRQS